MRATRRTTSGTAKASPWTGCVSRSRLTEGEHVAEHERELSGSPRAPRRPQTTKRAHPGRVNALVGSVQRSAPSGTRTPNPLIKSRRTGVSCSIALCSRAPFLHVRSGGLWKAVTCCAAGCRRLSEPSGSSRALQVHCGWRGVVEPGVVTGLGGVGDRSVSALSCWIDGVRRAKPGAQASSRGVHGAEPPCPGVRGLAAGAPRDEQLLYSASQAPSRGGCDGGH
jgi:hypothetical protein